MVKRYDMIDSRMGATMKVHEDGDWVPWEDFEEIRTDRDGWIALYNEQAEKLARLVNAANAPRDDLARFLVRLDAAVDQALNNRSKP